MKKNLKSLNKDFDKHLFSQKMNIENKFKYKFKKPTILAFMGIPGSGKSTIAYEVSHLINSICFLEKEEDFYPESVKNAFLNPDEKENILIIHFYFRNMRADYHRQAFENKLVKKSSVMDSYFSKLMLDILVQNDPATDYLINSKNSYFQKVIEISERDSTELPDADVVIFLRVSKSIHKKFLEKRNRSKEISENIYNAQKVFLQSSIKYAKLKNKLLIIIEQQNNLEAIVNQVIRELVKKDVIVKNFD